MNKVGEVSSQIAAQLLEHFAPRLRQERLWDAMSSS